MPNAVPLDNVQHQNLKVMVGHSPQLGSAVNEVPVFATEFAEVARDYPIYFRQDDKGQFLWPGFGENSRVLKWICERVDGVGKARSTPIGYVPTSDALDLGGLDIKEETIHQLMHVDPDEWLAEIPSIRSFYAQFEKRLPLSLLDNLESLKNRLKLAQDGPTSNKKLLEWVAQVKALCKPSKVGDH